MEQVGVRVWAKGSGSEGWVMLLQLALDMRALLFLGKNVSLNQDTYCGSEVTDIVQLANMTRSLPQNAVIFHLSDGVYTIPTNSISDFIPSAKPPQHAKSDSRHARQLPTSSFDALLRLQKLSDSIQDALNTRNQIATDLENLLQANKQALVDRDSVAEASDRLKTIDYAKTTVSKQLEKARAQQAEKRASLTARRKLMASDLETRGIAKQEMESTKPMFPSLREDHSKNETSIQGQRRRICEDLQLCYPIDPLGGRTLAFQIRGLSLPSSEDLDSVLPEQGAAALGHVAHVLQLLSFYLGQPLPYPVTPRGSTSTIVDPISILKSTSKKGDVRTYPLFPKGTPRFRFEYAVFLLNQNIRVLLESRWGLKTLDPRHMGANLKYLFFVATAGEGEVVGRKAGGVRGLMRRGSQDSVRSSGSLGKVVSNGRPKGAADRLREISASDGGGNTSRGKGMVVS